MANNRYFLHCPTCNEICFLGKSLGEGVYGSDLEKVHAFMWEHLLSCNKDGEWSATPVFQVITEYTPGVELNHESKQFYYFPLTPSPTKSDV